MIHSVQTVHYDEVYVDIGAVVTQGQAIGRFGTTGNSTGPHVHMNIIPVEWTQPTERWGITAVPGLGGTRQMIIDFTNSLQNPLLKRDGTYLPYQISVGGGWWGIDDSYLDHYSLDFIPIASSTPYPDVVWPYHKPGKIVAVNRTDRAAGLWIVATYDPDGGGGEGTGTRTKNVPFLYVPRPIW